MPRFESKPADAFEFDEISYAKSDMIATITIERPHRYNAYSTPALEELATAFTDAAFDDAVGVVVFTGAGTDAFCTGGDVKEYEAEYVSRPRDYWKYMRLFRAYIESIVNSGKPVIARLNGMAVGGGNESQMACDLAIMAEHAWIGQVGTRVGSVACGGATQWLPIMIGDRRAREMLLFNGQIPAYQCLEWGLVNRVVPRERLLEEAFAAADAIAANAPLAVRATRAGVRELQALPLDAAYRRQEELGRPLRRSADAREGQRAFVERRRPVFRGR